MKIDLLTIGDELLLGIRSNGHLAWLGEQLAQRGLPLRRNLSVRDGAEEIQQAFQLCWKDADIVITTGGLGPTLDDNTRESIAEALGCKMLFSEDAKQAIENRFARLGRKMNDLNLKQCYHPEGSQILPNPNGTAPGIHYASDGKHLFMLPGPTNELRPMVHDQMFPILEKAGLLRHGDAYLQLRTFGMGESALNETLQPVFDQYPAMEAAFCFHENVVDVRLSGDPETLPPARLREIGEACKELLGEDFLGFGDDSLAKIVFDLLRDKDAMISVAESCTGGLLADAFTGLPGVSKVFAGGVVCYKNDVKVQMLGVPEDILSQHGAVSAEVAAAMAMGAAERFDTEYAIATTGYAGPSGGDEENAVGTVYFGFYSPDGLWTLKSVFPGERSTVRSRAVNTALDMARRKILSYDHEHAQHHPVEAS